MIPWLDIANLIGHSVRDMLAHPIMFMPFFAVLCLVFVQYRRLSAMTLAVHGMPLYSAGEQLLPSIGIGMLGGIVATVLFVGFGITLPASGILPVWLLALLLMLIHPRFICFAYAGGLVALSSLLFGVPQVNVAGLLALVAILHFVEAILIWFTGGQHAVPIYVRQPDGRLIGGFMLQKFWPIPFFALLGLFVPLEQLADGLAMPDWWPLIGMEQYEGANASIMYALFPVTAALGYGDMVLTSEPKQKARRTAGHLFVYSVVLLALCMVATSHQAGAWAAALFSPLAHELVIYAGRRIERQGKPRYSGAYGAMVLATKPGSAAEQMGLHAGDIIKRCNGYNITCRDDVEQAVSPWAFSLDLQVYNVFTEQQRDITYQGKVPPLGAIFAPHPYDATVHSVRVNENGPLARWFMKQRARWSSSRRT